MFTVSKNLLKEVHHARTDNFLARPVLLRTGERLVQVAVMDRFCTGSFLRGRERGI